MTYLSSRMPTPSPLAFLVSLLLHLFFLLLLSFGKPVAPSDLPVFTVTLEPEARSQRSPQKERDQIVTPPDAPPSENPAETKFQSDRDVKVERESIKRGDPDAGPAIGPLGAQPPAPQSVPNKTEQVKSKAPASNERKPVPASAAPQEKLALRLDENTLLKEFATSNKPRAESIEDLNSPSAGSYTPFSRPFGSGAAFLGSRGSRDFIPTLPDGDITLLNTKANQFAVFVRRVATNVFGQLRSAGWEVVRSNDIHQISEYATVRAELSLKGELLNVRIDGHSGSTRFDEVVRSAVQGGARDPNPPPAAAGSDGKIRFVFQAKSWSRYGANPRSGAPVEKRWLLLATGLE